MSRLALCFLTDIMQLPALASDLTKSTLRRGRDGERGP